MQGLQLYALYNKNPITTHLRRGLPILSITKEETVGLTLLKVGSE